ncbi:hypothetical protein [Parasitella parasitica]|uniref:Uncharacterized protein n=1 Tax=Parasitella parasitica TaxID=35722 RepID=A0A0B7NAT2_9FUNG|nr:hypothetical protein [Parasitella parasitica]
MSIFLIIILNISTFLSAIVFSGTLHPQKRYQQAVKIKVKTTPTTKTNNPSGTLPANSNTVSLSSRLTTKRQSTLSQYPSKLPIAQKHRFSTLKTTTVPSRTSVRFKKRDKSSVIVDPNTSTDPTVSPSMSSTAITPNTDLVATATYSSLLIPRPEDIHSHPEMPTWISNVYARLAQHDKSLDEIKQLLTRNNELEAALAQANRRIAELEASSTPTISPAAVPTSQAPTTSNARADGISVSRWVTIAATTTTTPTVSLSSTRSQRPNTAKKTLTEQETPTLASIARF